MITPHLYRVFDYVRQADRWLTSNEIAKGAKVDPRPARAHALYLTKARILDRAEVFP
jgi:hypothetical protein